MARIRTVGFRGRAGTSLGPMGTGAPLWRCKEVMRSLMDWYGLRHGQAIWAWSTAAGPYSPLPTIVGIRRHD
jgi:hypothetical protein